jgi:formamidopyrimidine-DNA glycosylase
MIELPEASTIARQMDAELQGKVIESGMRGNAPHKFAFYNHTPEEYAAILQGKTIGQVTYHGALIMASLEPEHVLFLGGRGREDPVSSQ